VTHQTDAPDPALVLSDAPGDLDAEEYIDALAYLVESMTPYEAVGIGFPCVVLGNRVRETTPEFSEIWNRVEPLIKSRGIPYCALNDADAAGILPESGWRNRSSHVRRRKNLKPLTSCLIYST